MRRISLLSLSCLSLLALSACRWNAEAPVNTEPMEETPVEEPVQKVEKDVTYEGTLEPAGISIYMEGSHRLMLTNGDFLLLQSDDLDLAAYEGKRVSVFGDVRPTVEGGGKIMTVKQIERIEAEDETSSSPSSEEQETSSIAPASATSSSESSVASSKASSVSSYSASSEKASSEPSSGTSDAVKARADLMAKDDMSASLWVQQYCTSHIGFCIPVHKNWWFKSFGTTTSTLWHVEIAPEELQNLGDGPLVVNLMSGSVESKGAGDGDTVTKGDFIIGYRAWTENRHFEISAPTNLKAAVSYITKSLTAYETQ